MAQREGRGDDAEAAIRGKGERAGVIVEKGGGLAKGMEKGKKSALAPPSLPRSTTLFAFFLFERAAHHRNLQHASRMSRFEGRNLVASVPLFFQSIISRRQRHEKRKTAPTLLSLSQKNTHLSPDARVLGGQLQLRLPGFAAGSSSRVGGSHF